MTAAVVHNPEKSRFELRLDGAVAVACYERQGDAFVLTHTEVPKELSGRGVGSKLARGVFEAIRAQGGRAVVQCSFMAGYAEKHLEVADLVERTA